MEASVSRKKDPEKWIFFRVFLVVSQTQFAYMIAKHNYFFY